MTSSLTRAIRYLEQAITSVENCVLWLEQAGVNAPFVLAEINDVLVLCARILADCTLLVTTVENQQGGPDWAPIASLARVNLTIGQAATMYVVPAGKTFVPVRCVARCTLANAPAADGSVYLGRRSDAINLNLGRNDAATIVGEALNLVVIDIDPFFLVVAGDAVQFIVTIPDTGVGFTCAVDLFGYLI